MQDKIIPIRTSRLALIQELSDEQAGRILKGLAGKGKKNNIGDKEGMLLNILLQDIEEYKEKQRPQYISKGMPASLSQEESKMVDYFNSEITRCSSKIPKVTAISPRRTASLHARLKEYGADKVKTAITKAAESNFLSGDNGRGFRASFDWIMRPNNFPKVLEGNYDNREYHQNGNGNTNWRQQQVDAAETYATRRAEAVVKEARR